MNKTYVYTLVGILIFILIAGGVVIAIKSLNKNNTGNISGVKFWHEDTSWNYKPWANEDEE